MKTYKNHINGKDYLYAYDTIFIAKGKKIQKTKSLGPMNAPGNLSVKEQKFMKYLIEEEAKLRTDYWGRKISNQKFSKYLSIEKIEKVRAQLYRSKEEMGWMGTAAMETAFQVDFIYNSNKIEGSKIPRTNVQKQVQANTGGNNEVSNTIKAIQFVNDKFKMNLKNIEKLHSILMAHEPSKLGYRQERVVVGDVEVMPWNKVKNELKELIVWYKENNGKWYPPELAFTFYYRFERIHPFIDGNGRTGRLIMNRILKDHKYHPMIIWNQRRIAHATAFKKYMKGKSETYFKFMAEQFIKTHNIYIEKIEKAFNLEKQTKFFLKPSKY